MSRLAPSLTKTFCLFDCFHFLLFSLSLSLSLSLSRFYATLNISLVIQIDTSSKGETAVGGVGGAGGRGREAEQRNGNDVFTREDVVQVKPLWGSVTKRTDSGGGRA